MATNRAKPFKKLIFISLTSAALFVVMYILTNNASEKAFHYFMRDNFGMTDKWSATYGPQWLVDISNDISDLGGHTDFILIVIFVACFLFFLREEKKLIEFLFTIIGAAILLLIVKFAFNANSPDNLFAVLFADDLGFPSGHALMSIVLYSSLAKYSGRKLIYTSARYVIYSFAAILILLIGISRLFTSHTPTEVIAGWCAGIFWLSIVNYFFGKK